MVNKAVFGTILSIVVTTLVFLICDYYGVVITALTPYGVTHWIPEFFALVCMAYWATGKLGSLMMKVIAFCVFLYSVLTYFLLRIPLQLGIGTGTFFVVAILFGIWLRVK